MTDGIEILEAKAVPGESMMEAYTRETKVASHLFMLPTKDLKIFIEIAAILALRDCYCVEKIPHTHAPNCQRLNQLLDIVYHEGKK